METKRFKVVNTYTRSIGIKRPYNTTYCKLECNCGQVWDVHKSKLSRVIACRSCTKSLNQNKKKGGKYLTVPHYSVLRRTYMSYKRRAVQKDLDFLITEEHCLKLFNGNCHYCGIEPQPVKSTTDNGNTLDGHLKRNTIDRVCSDKGYTMENTVSCCDTCNRAKLTMSRDTFLDWINRVYNFQRKGSSTIPHEGSTLK